MRATKVMRAAAVMAVLVAPPREAAAQAADQAQQIQQQIDQLKREFNDRVAALEAQLAALQGGQPAPPPQPAAPPWGCSGLRDHVWLMYARRRLVASSTARATASASCCGRTIADPDTSCSDGGNTNTTVTTAMSCAPTRRICA